MEDKINLIKESENNDEKPLVQDSKDINDNKNPSVNNLANSIPINKDKLKAEINNAKVNDTNTKDLNLKPKKEIPIEKKPFNEFINNHLIPTLIDEFKERGFKVNEIYLKKTNRPISGDECWVIYCDVEETCTFWLSFERDDISSLKSISLCKPNQKPSVIESFLIDEKRITLKLIISRIFQRLNGQKLIGIN